MPASLPDSTSGTCTLDADASAQAVPTAAASPDSEALEGKPAVAAGSGALETEPDIAAVLSTAAAASSSAPKGNVLPRTAAGGGGEEGKRLSFKVADGSGSRVLSGRAAKILCEMIGSGYPLLDEDCHAVGEDDAFVEAAKSMLEADAEKKRKKREKKKAKAREKVNTI